MLDEVWADMASRHGCSTLPGASLGALGWAPLPALPEVGANAFQPAEAAVRSLPLAPCAHVARGARGAARELAALGRGVDTHVLEFGKFGKEGPKGWGVSPDAAVQMAFQVAYARAHPPAEGDALSLPATYEACAMRHVFRGRTETIRSATIEAQALVEAMLDDGATAEAKRDALRAACKRHIEVAGGAKAASGPNLGVDRHLHALKTLAQQQWAASDPARLAKSPLFSDPLFARSSTWTLSTSNVTTDFFDLFGFGAVSGDGYGLGYMTLEGNMPVCVTTFGGGETDSAGLAAGIAAALEEFDELFRDEE